MYALSNCNILLVKDVIRAIHKLPRGHEEELNMAAQQSRSKVNALLNAHYQFGRLPTSNPYEVYDYSTLADHYNNEGSIAGYVAQLSKSASQPPQVNLLKFRKALEADLSYNLKPFSETQKVDIDRHRGQGIIEPPLKKRMRQPRFQGPIVSAPKISVLPGMFLRNEQSEPSLKLNVQSASEQHHLSKSEEQSILPDPFRPFLARGFLQSLSLQAPTFSNYDKFEGRFDQDFKQTDKKVPIVKATKIELPRFPEDLPNNPSGVKIPISYRLFDTLCDYLLYCSDRKFALQAAELIYALCQIKFEEPLTLTSANSTDPLYYANRKNQLFCEFIETMHNKRAETDTQQAVTLQGLVVQSSSKTSEEHLSFTPKESDYALEQKISRRVNISEFGEIPQIAPGEFGVLEDLSSSGRSYLCCIKECQPIRMICPFFRPSEATFVRFTKLLNRKVFDRTNSALSNVSRKNMSVLNRSNVHLVMQYPSCSTNFLSQLMLDWTKTGQTVLLTGCNIDEAYNNLTTFNLNIIKVTSKTEEKTITSTKPQVFCTCIYGCASDIFKNVTFTRAVILQANAIPEYTSLLALSKGCRKVVLVGDSKQPPPSTFSPLAKSKGSCISLFQRLLDEGYPVSAYSDCCSLPPPIQLFLNQHFYGGKLQLPANSPTRPCIKGFPWPNTELRFCFVQCKGKQQQFSHSTINLAEAETSVRVLANVFEAGFTALDQIEIVAGYEQQRRLVLYLLHCYLEMYASAKKDFQLPVQDISSLCSLVDENQNVGKELIIFTGCHHNKDGRIGRLSDLRRLNSFLLGDLETFGRNPTWNNLINWALKNRLVLQLE